MGFECKLSFQCPSREAAERLLSSLQDVEYVASSSPRFEFGRHGSSHEMPDATASFEEYGLYFCDHGGHGRAYLGQVVASLVTHFGPVVVAELE